MQRSPYHIVPLLLAALAVPACGAIGSGSSSGSLTPPAKRIAPTSMTFTYQTVDDPTSTTNEVTAIEESGAIVGTYGSGTASDPYEGYSSTSPYSSFEPIDYSNAKDTVVTGLSSSSSRTVISAYVVTPGQLLGTWAAFNIDGLWALTKDHKEGKGKNAVTAVLGVNDSEYGAGYYINSTGAKMPIVINIPTESYIGLKPPGAKGAEGTGINDTNDVSGWETNSGGSTEGFFYRVGTYYKFAYAGAESTEALSINAQDQIVVFYVDSNAVKHGFIVTNPASGSPTWKTIDEPNAVNGTVVTGIDNDDDICGYYFDSDGVQHGFVANPN
jgi:hypothetical protein